MVAQKNNPENTMPLLDEGWWLSVMMDEGRFLIQTSPRSTTGKLGDCQEATGTLSVKKPKPNWDLVKDLYNRDQIVDLVVNGHNRGGLLVEGNGVCGFVPFSHLIDQAGKVDQIERDHILESYTGRLLHLKVIECMPEEERVVFSERAAQSETGKRAEIFNALNPGQNVKGVVTNVTDFGVFVDLGGVEGLIHISELSWGRVSHPSQIVKIGSIIEVQVLDLTPQRCRVALSLKRLLPNPWANASAEFPEGSIKSAIITSVLSFGAFARLEAGVEGLIHASEIPQAEDLPLKEILSEGQNVSVRVLHLDKVHQRMGLSLRIRGA